MRYFWGVSSFFLFLSFFFFSPSDVKAYLFTGGKVTFFISLFLFVKNWEKKNFSFKLAALFVTLLLGLYTVGAHSYTFAFLEQFSIPMGTSSLSLLSLLKLATFVAVLSWGSSYLSRKIEERLDKLPHMHPSTQVLFTKVIKTVLLTLSLFLGMALTGIDVSLFAFFMGALGVSIGFGLQNIFSNFFSGILLLVDRSVKPGDVISLEEGKLYGVVHKLNARYVCVRTRDGKEHIIPNEQFVNQRFQNWSYSDPNVRITIPFKVALESDLELVEKLLLQIAGNTPRILTKPESKVCFTSIHENVVEVELKVWISDPKNGTSSLESGIIVQACKLFREHNVQIPYIPYEVYYQKPDVRDPSSPITS